MDRTFAVVRVRGRSHNPDLPLEAQEGWKEHAAFMNALEDEGFIIVGGPLEGTAQVLLIVRGQDKEDIKRRLTGDPWLHSGHLRLETIAPRDIRLGELA